MDRINVARYSGLGDVLMVCGLAKALKSLTPGLLINFITNPAYIPLLENCPHIDEFNAAVGGAPVFDFSDCKFGVAQMHQIDAYLAEMKITVTNPGDKSIDLQSDSVVEYHVYEWLEQNTSLSSRKVVIHPAITDPNRTYPIFHWQSLVDMLIAQGFTVISIGTSQSLDGKSVFSLERVVDAVDQLSLRESMELIKNCDLMISTDSGPIQLAGATKTPILGIYSTVRGENRLPFRSEGRSVCVQAPCPMSGCYKYMGIPKYWSENALPKLNGTFAYWCPDKADYRCIRTLDPHNVFHAAMGLLEVPVE